MVEPEAYPHLHTKRSVQRENIAIRKSSPFIGSDIAMGVIEHKIKVTQMPVQSQVMSGKPIVFTPEPITQLGTGLPNAPCLRVATLRLPVGINAFKMKGKRSGKIPVECQVRRKCNPIKQVGRQADMRNRLFFFCCNKRLYRSNGLYRNYRFPGGLPLFEHRLPL